MSLVLRSPATQSDLAACAGTTTMQVWAMARVQVRLGPSWALRTQAGATVACGGYVAHPSPSGDLCEGWFMASPEAARHMLAVVRAIRLTGVPDGYRRRIVFVSTAAGRRIAEMCGFRFLAQRDDGMEVYTG
jgi:hypothetical protein